MINKLYLKNFKVFRDTEIELRPLNLFTGLNDVGKSAIFQSLLLLRQSYLEAKKTRRLSSDFPLHLNGEYVRLGGAKEVLHYTDEGRSKEGTLVIGIDDGLTGYSEWKYVNRRNTNFFVNTFVLGNTPIVFDAALFSTDGRFKYIKADRGGFQDYHYKNFLLENANNDTQLIEKIIEWMSVITPNTKIETDVDGFWLENVGVGASYVLPIVVAMLSSVRGDMVLLEYPEAYLSQHGQVQLGFLISQAAAAGVQIICETHSDHIFNAVRISAKRGDITPGDVALYYLNRDNTTEARLYMPQLDFDGRLSF